LRNDWQRFNTAQIGIIAIGQGSVAKTKAFREQLALPFPLLADPRRLAYTAYNLLRMDLRREAGLGRLAHTVKATLTYGAALSSDQDMRQLGGVFVVGTDGLTRFAHRSESVTNVPRHDALLQAAQS
jgi:peroxiredoxin